MEGFEHLVKVAMEYKDGLVCSGPMKFPVQRQTQKQKTVEKQTHGYEVDIVGARKDLLVLASIKSHFGSKGVGLQGFRGLADPNKKPNYKGFILFNEEEIQKGVIEGATKRFGYSIEQVELRLYVGRFKSEEAQRRITEHLSNQVAGRGPIRVIGLQEILSAVVDASQSKTYINDPVIITVKAFSQRGSPKLP